MLHGPDREVRKDIRLNILISTLLVFTFALPLVCLPGFLQAQVDTKKQDETEKKYVIRVGDQVVTADEFKTKLEKSLRKTMRRLKQKGNESPDKESLKKNIFKKLTSRMVNRLLFENHARKSNVTVTDTEVRRRLEKKIQEEGSREALIKKLEANKSNLDELREKLRTRIRVEKFIQKNRPDYEITEKEVQEAYEKNKDKFEGKDKSKVKRYLRNKIRSRKEQFARKQLLRTLREKSEVEINYSVLSKS